MARIRSIKPGFFKDEDLADLSFGHRLLFAGLWTLADKHGNLEDRPRYIKAELFPYDDCDVAAWLVDLKSAGFVLGYRVAGRAYLNIPTFTKHQRISGDERNNPTSLPTPLDADRSSDEAGKKQSRSSHEAAEKQARSGGEGGVLSTEYGVLSTEHGETEGVRASVVRMDSQWGGLPTRRKLHCAFESAIGLDVPQFLHDEFLARLTNAGTENADAVLHAWYATTEAAYRGRVVGEDALRFWRARFAEWQGVTAKAAPVADDGWMPPVRKGAR